MADKLLPEFGEGVIAFLCTTCLDGEIAEILNAGIGTALTGRQIFLWRRNHKIKCGRTGQWGEPYRKKDTFVPKPGQRMSLKTEFQKGNRPHNTAPIGTEVIVNKGFIKVKISNDKTPAYKNWKFKHILVWEKFNGPVPAGKRIIFINGNRQDCTIDNLRLVSIHDLGALRWCLPPDPDNQEYNQARINAALLLAAVNRKRRKQ